MQKVKSMSLIKRLIPIFIGSIIIIIAIWLCKSPYDDYNNAAKANKTQLQEKKNLEDQVAQLDSEKAQQKANMSTLKPFLEMTNEFSPDSLASFGSMLDDIVENYIKPNGVMVRSIDYQIDPPEDPISSAFSPNYHSCVIELRLIAKYPQLHDLVYQLINDFPNFISLSQLVVTAYPADKEYLDINLKVNLYVKKQGVI